jgi:hypothetical protein
MAPTLPIAQLASDKWKAEVFDAVALGYGIASAVKLARNAHIVSRKLWALDRQLKSTLDVFYGPHLHPAEPPTKEGIEAGIAACRALAVSFDNLAAALSKAGLSNYSKISGPVLSSMERIADLLEFAESADVSIDPAKKAAAAAIFDYALQEFRDGRTVEFDSLV